MSYIISHLTTPSSSCIGILCVLAHAMILLPPLGISTQGSYLGYPFSFSQPLSGELLFSSDIICFRKSFLIPAVSPNMVLMLLLGGCHKRRKTLACSFL